MQSLWQREGDTKATEQGQPASAGYSQAYYQESYGSYYPPYNQEQGQTQYIAQQQEVYSQQSQHYGNYYYQYQQYGQYPPYPYPYPPQEPSQPGTMNIQNIQPQLPQPPHTDKSPHKSSHQSKNHTPPPPQLPTQHHSTPNTTLHTSSSTTTTTTPTTHSHNASSHSNTNQDPQMYLPPLSALDTRINAFMSSLDPLHTPLIAKFKKIGDKPHSSKPSLSSSSENISLAESGFCKVPPFQEFAGLPVVNSGDSLVKRKRVYEELHTRINNGLVVGVVEAKRPFGLLVQIRRVTDFDGVFERGALASNLLESYKIKALCHLSELSNDFVSDVEDLGEAYDVGRTVRGLLLAVDVGNERINLSFKMSRLPDICDYKLGPISDSGTKSRDHSPVRESTPYNTYLQEDPSFYNPTAPETMMRHFRIDESDLSFLGEFALDDIAKKTFDRLRDAQNSEWAQETVAKGIGYAKQGDYKKAMQCYQQALDVDPKHRDAFVARGAAYANMHMLEQAVGEFEIALKIDPDDKNARKYLSVTKAKLREKDKDKDKEKGNDDDKGRASLRGSSKEGGEKEKEKDKEEEKQLTDKLKNLLEAEERERKRKKKKKKDRERDRGAEKEEGKDGDSNNNNDKDHDKDKKNKDKDKKKEKKKHKKEKKHKHKHKKRKHDDPGSDSVEEVDAHGKSKKSKKEKENNVISLSPG